MPPQLQLTQTMAGQEMQLEDWLDDLCVRFIINLPQEDLSSVERICFQVEEAQWFYEDFIRPLDPALPTMSLRTFCLRIFEHCPLLASFSVENHMAAFESFLQYKTRIPVRGAILLNRELDSVVLVKGWKKGSSWSFPRGKINKDEDDLDCAVREVYEETGMDLRAHDLIPTTEKPIYIEIAMREQQLRLYVFRNVPMDYNFQPQTRKEISKIQWYKLSELPTFRKKNAQNQNDAAAVGGSKFYMVAPFLVPLKKWVVAQKQLPAKPTVANLHLNTSSQARLSADEGHTEDDAYASANYSFAGHPQQPTSITSLDGATQELHRLLKTQPPTQGLQAQPDKGSALLSILQSDNPPPTSSYPEQNMEQLPHTSHGHILNPNPAQPNNPHHHSNQRRHANNANTQEPPRLFSFNNDAAVFIPQPQQQHYPTTQSVFQGYSNVSQQQQQQLQISTPLVHTQPLPPQIQRTMFNNSAFQGTGGNPHAISPYQHWQQPVNMQGIAPFQQTVQPAQLSGQSMALLNAFKREPSGSQQLSDHQRQPMHMAETNMIASAGPATQSQPTVYGQPPYQQQQQQQQQQQHPGGPLNQAHNNPRRSTLLSMFKEPRSKSPSKLPAGQLHSPRVPSGLVSELTMPSQQQHNSPLRSVSIEAGIGNLAIQPSTPASQYQPGQASPAQQPSSLAPRSTIASPYVSRASVSYQTMNPALLSGGTGASAVAGGDKKRHLLSLFSSGASCSPSTSANVNVNVNVNAQAPQTSSSLGATIHEIGSGNPSQLASMMTSPAGSGGGGGGGKSRSGSQTPMSPADESFLLGYLHSVNSKASR